ncbi:MAG: DUF4397 domain-containing protein [Flavobacteriales bacterium]|nr:DUF4397 domain-containing protein [Flavobacteriales bacterium]
MRTRTTLSILAGSLATALSAQTARVQVIHNCADMAASVVDVYLDNTLLFDDVAFRTASPFVDAPAGVQFTVGIAPSNSTSAADAIYTQDFTLVNGETYVVVASGIVSGTGYDPSPAFTLAATAMGREAASMMTNTDLMVFHGSTDAPTVDVYESGVLNVTAVDDLAYGSFTSYLELPTNDYTIQVRDENNSTIVAAYSAPLATLGLDGAAAVVVASGFLDPSMNSNGPAFGLWVALPSGGALVELPSAPIPTARVQVIHNSADAAAASVDVWLNNTLLLDDFAFRTASPFVDAQAGVPFDVTIAGPSSTDTTNAVARFTYSLEEGETYILVANGIVSGSGYMPSIPFDILVHPMGQETAMMGTNTDLLVLHGSTDAPTVDVHEQTTGELIDDLMYGDFAGYLALPTADYTVQVRDENNSSIVVAYSAPLATLGLNGAAAVVLASGFLDPSMNSSGPAFGLWVALPAGGDLVELPSAAIPTARVQVIHNSADAAAASVDVWLNNTLLLDDFAFRTASPFVDAQAGVPFDVTIAGPGSSDTTNAVARYTYTLEEGETYILIANGIVSGTGYDVTNPLSPFDIYVYAGARETGANGASNTDILVFHGSTDAPTVDVVETAVLGGATLVSNLSYGDYAMDYLEPPTNDYVLQINAGGNPVVAYQAPLAALNLGGAAITVVASGFLDPSMNSNGPGFGLWVALAGGGDLVELPIATSVNESAGILASTTLFPNPADNAFDLMVPELGDRDLAVELMDVTGRMVRTQAAGNMGNARGRMTIGTADIPAGSYFVRLRSENNVIALPIQIVH